MKKMNEMQKKYFIEVRNQTCWSLNRIAGLVDGAP